MTTTADSPSNLVSLSPEPEGSRVHPLIHAGKWLAADLFSTLLFVGLYALTHSVYVATGLAIVAGLGQIAYLKMRRAPIDAMQWMSLGLVVVFGGASLMTHDPRFIMLKPTLIYTVIGAVMLKRGWIDPLHVAGGADLGPGCGRRLRLCLGRDDVRHRRAQPGHGRPWRSQGSGLGSSAWSRWRPSWRCSPCST